MAGLRASLQSIDQPCLEFKTTFRLGSETRFWFARNQLADSLCSVRLGKTIAVFQETVLPKYRRIRQIDCRMNSFVSETLARRK